MTIDFASLDVDVVEEPPPGYVPVPDIVRENTTYLTMIEIKEDAE